ncbi:hypothetical protein KIH39_13820 [Telmatocola sphagniphila]|uniref:Uncharacterized protein n=1 Tax=Telmatocola sphagniphila TaxID=1123043 RepID=A0A8E6ETH6_9BACT|nr:hypothetical protein [Telmatocola sphagniphila]QVL29947.1 hypothetical protein KIH39_13820 [Telmatocola sphagniphila]
MRSIYISGLAVLALTANATAQRAPAGGTPQAPSGGNTTPQTPQGGNNPTAPAGGQNQPQNPGTNPGTGNQQNPTQNPNQNPKQNTNPLPNNQNFNAQRPYNYPFSIYGMNGVSKSLNLTQAQMDRLNSLTQNTQNRFNRDFSGLSNLNETERANRMNELNRQYQSAWMSGARDIFNQNQFNRYQQLHYQYGGFNTLNDPDIQTKLNLTAQQKNNLSNSIDWSRQQLQEIQRVGQSNPDRGNVMYREYQSQYQNRLNQFLTPEQQKVWQQLVGESYNFQPTFNNTNPNTSPNNSNNSNTPPR